MFTIIAMANTPHKAKSAFRLAVILCTTAFTAASCTARHVTETPATSPVGPGTSSVHVGSNISSQAIELTDKERTLLGDVRDQDGQLYEPPMYGLLAKTAKMEKPSSRDFDNLPWPGYQQLLEHPSTYRAQAMKVKLFVHTVQELTGAVSIYYEKDKPYWLLGCTNAACKTPSQEPLLVLCPFDPIEILGKPERTEDDGVMSYEYPQGTQFELAGVFYKIHTEMDRGDKNREPVLRDYPVFIAWDIRKVESGGGNAINKTMILMIILAMAAAFFILKRHVKRLKNMGETEIEPYRPRRYEPKRDEPESQDGESDETLEVDEDLKKAVQEFRQKEKPDDRPAKD